MTVELEHQPTRSNLQILLDTKKLYKNWATVLCDTGGLIKGKQLIFKLKNGIKVGIRAHSYDRKAFNTVWLYDAYLLDLFTIQPGDVVVDIGAHIGSFSLYAANLAKEGKVIAYEPFPDNFELLKFNAELNHFDNITPVCAGISGKKEVKYLHVDEGNTAGHSVFSEGKAVEAQFITLQDVFETNGIEQIDFLKIDCEGSEYDILFNAPENCVQRVKKVAMEYHEGMAEFDLNDLVTFFEENDFNVLKTIQNEDKITGMLYAINSSL